MLKCPKCGGAIDVEPDDVEEGDAISCDECGADLKVAGVNPLEVETTEGLDEDEEDDEDFLDDDEEEEEEEEEEEDWK